MADKMIGGTLAVELDIRREKASGLRRVAQTLDKLREELADLQRRALSSEGEARARLVARFTEVRQEAEKHLWYMVVQREAMGLSRHDDVYDLYRLPPLDFE